MPNPILKIDVKPADFKKPSVIILIAANMVPIIGAIFLKWEVFPILLLFWMENVIVGIFNVFKMLVASTGSVAENAAKVSTILFFCVHYGMFTAIHGVFVFVVFGFVANDSLDFTTLVQSVLASQLIWGVIAVTISHGVSFIVNYLGKGEYKRTTINTLMMQPYQRVVILHLTILFGGFLVMALGSPVIGLILLVIIKIGFDVVAHLKQHSNSNLIFSKTRSGA